MCFSTWTQVDAENLCTRTRYTPVPTSGAVSHLSSVPEYDISEPYPHRVMPHNATAPIMRRATAPFPRPSLLEFHRGALHFPADGSSCVSRPGSVHLSIRRENTNREHIFKSSSLRFFFQVCFQLHRLTSYFLAATNRD